MSGVVLRTILEPVSTLFFPLHCCGCGKAVSGGDLCGTCASTVVRIVPPRCEACSQPYAATAPVLVCPNCRDEAFHFEAAVAVCRSRGVVREAIHRLKYGSETWLARFLGNLLREGLGDPRLAGRTFAAICPVPLHPKRRRERGFNQSELLAAELSRHTGWPVLDALRRGRYTGTQTELDRRARRQNLREAIVLRKNVQDMTLLLVDDVLTTGSTLDACAAALVEGGAASVFALTSARG